MSKKIHSPLLIPILACAFVWLLAACAHTPPPPEPKQILLPDGKTVEERIERDFSGRVVRVFQEYRDTAGNYVRHGSDRRYYRYGQPKYAEQYRDGKLEGLSEFWYENGAKQGELPYRDGKPHGQALTWYPDGKKKSETGWADGRLDGTSREWNEKGEKTGEVLWRNNMRVKADSLNTPGP